MKHTPKHAQPPLLCLEGSAAPSWRGNREFGYRELPRDKHRDRRHRGVGAAQVSLLLLGCAGGRVCLIAAPQTGIICRYESHPGGRSFLLAVCVNRLSSSSQLPRHHREGTHPAGSSPAPPSPPRHRQLRDGSSCSPSASRESSPKGITGWCPLLLVGWRIWLPEAPQHPTAWVPEWGGVVDAVAMAN